MDETGLDELLAKQAITEGLHRYCRAMDRCDGELGRSVFHPDAPADYGEMFNGGGHAFVAFAIERQLAMLTHHHQLGNVLVRVEGDVAHSEAYVTAVLRTMSGDELVQLTSRGRYLDRWERRHGRWRIAHRRYLHAMDETRPVQASAFADGGRRDREDASYGGLAADMPT